MSKSEAHNPRTRSRAALSFTLVAVLVIAGMVLVYALPGAPTRKYPHRIPVRFWHSWTAEWKGVIDKICQRFNESQSVYEVIPLSVPGSTADAKFVLSMAGGHPPDVMTRWDGVSKWADAGVLTRLNDLMTPEEWAAYKRNVYPAIQKIGIYKGNLYGVTTGMNTWACYCRLDDLRQAGLDPAKFPKTLEGLVAWGRKLNRFDAHGNLTRMGFMPTWFAMYATGFGGGFCNWKTGKLTLDTPQNLRAMTFLVDQRRKLGFDNVVRFEAGLTVGVGNAEWPFISGAYSITVDGQWRVQQLAKYAPHLKYITRPIPPPKGGKPLFGWTNGNFLVIPKGAKHVRGAWAFIKFWSGLDNPKRAAKFYTWGGWLPLMPAVANAPIYKAYVRKHPQFKTFLEVLASKNIEPTPPVPYEMYLWDRITAADDAAMRGTLTPKQALARLAREIARERASRKELGYKD